MQDKYLHETFHTQISYLCFYIMTMIFLLAMSLGHPGRDICIVQSFLSIMQDGLQVPNSFSVYSPGWSIYIFILSYIPWDDQLLYVTWSMFAVSLHLLVSNLMVRLMLPKHSMISMTLVCYWLRSLIEHTLNAQDKLFPLWVSALPLAIRSLYFLMYTFRPLYAVEDIWTLCFAAPRFFISMIRCTLMLIPVGHRLRWLCYHLHLWRTALYILLTPPLVTAQYSYVKRFYCCRSFGHMFIFRFHTYKSAVHELCFSTHCKLDDLTGLQVQNLYIMFPISALLY